MAGADQLQVAACLGDRDVVDTQLGSSGRGACRDGLRGSGLRGGPGPASRVRFVFWQAELAEHPVAQWPAVPGCPLPWFRGGLHLRLLGFEPAFRPAIDLALSED